MATIAKLSVALTANTGKFEAAMKRAGTSVKSFGGTLARLGGALAALTAAAVLAATAGMAVMIRRSFALIDATAKLADQLAISTEALIGWRLGAELAGASSEALEKSLQQMNRRLGEAAGGTGTALRGLETLGITLEDLAGLSTEDKFRRIADGIAEMEDVTKKASAANELFGRSGQQILNFLNQGSAGLDAATAEAEALGAALSRTDAAKIEMANDAMTRLKAAFRGIANQMAITLAPALKAAADWFTRMVTEGGGLANILEKSRERFRKLASVGASVAQAIGYGFRLMERAGRLFAIGTIEAFGKVAGQANGLLDLFGLGSNTLKGLEAAAKGTADSLRTELEKFDADTEKFVSNDWGQQVADFFKGFDADAEKVSKAAAAMAKLNEVFQQLAAAAELARKRNEELEAQADRVRDAIRTPAEQLAEETARLKVLFDAGKLSLDEYTRAMQEATRRLDPLITEAERLTEAMRTPLEKFRDEVGRIQELFDRGLIDQTTFDRAIERARAQLERLTVEPKVRSADFRQVNLSKIDLGSGAARSRSSQPQRVHAPALEEKIDRIADLLQRGVPGLIV